VDVIGFAKDSVRVCEQLSIEQNCVARSGLGGTSGNQINGISPNNKENRGKYIRACVRAKLC
jgi:hypothetical protein